MEEVVADLRLTGDDPLLVSMCTPRGRTVTVPMLWMFMRKAAVMAGLAGKNYTPHSLRRGGGGFCLLQHGGTVRTY